MLDDYSQLLGHFSNLAIACAIGLVVGSERGWHHRERGEGARVAGIRTFTVVAMLGGLVGTITNGLAGDNALLICALTFVPLALLLSAGHWQATRIDGDLSITTEVAAMVTFWLGVMPAFNLTLPAAASAVILALLLHLKEPLHRWLEVLDRKELLGTLQFLLVSVVVLPLLPNRGFGPWDALNPYQLWWMVVLISGLSLLGYFAMRLAGPRRGIVATSLAGGIASSTAVTLSLSRLHRDTDAGARMVGAGILLACSTMYARMLIVIFVLNQPLAWLSLAPLAMGFLILLGLALWRLQQGETESNSRSPAVQNPFQLLPALQFGTLLAVVMIAARALREWFGETGLYLLAVFTGIADVDAIVLSLAPQAGGSLAPALVIVCISLAAATNTVMKGIYCRAIAGPELGRQVLLPLAATSALVLTLAAGIAALGVAHP